MTALEFCLARLAEDEESARAVSRWGRPETADPLLAHLCRHDPERILHRVAGERALLDAAPGAAAILAQAWTDHPDYDSEWT